MTPMKRALHLIGLAVTQWSISPPELFRTWTSAISVPLTFRLVVNRPLTLTRETWRPPEKLPDFGSLEVVFLDPDSLPPLETLTPLSTTVPCVPLRARSHFFARQAIESRCIRVVESAIRI